MHEVADEGKYELGTSKSTASAVGVKPRLYNLDFLKALAMFMVVSLHAGTWDLATPENSVGFYFQYACRLLSEGVPIFVMVNGYLLFSKEGFSLRDHLHKTLRILLLLVLWSLILVVVGSIMNGASLAPNTIWNLFINTKLGSLYSGPMWFMQALFALYLVYPLLRVAYEHPGKLFEFVFIVVCVFTVGTSALSSLVSLQETLAPNVNALRESFEWVLRLSPLQNGAFLLFFMLGGILKRHGDLFSRHRMVWILGGCAAFAGSFAFCVCMTNLTGKVFSVGYNYCSLFTPFLLVGLYCLTLRFHGKHLCAIVRRIGSDTLGIYFIHMIVIWAILPLFGALPLGWRIAELLLIFVICCIATRIISLIPGVRRMVRL